MESFTGLTPRQLQVAELVASGCTNRQIAIRLRISPRTAETHLDDIRNRLGMSSRAQIAAWAAGRAVAATAPRQLAAPPTRRPAPGTRLPAPLTRFVGRVGDLGRLRDLIGKTRLLTLWGPGGSGKTRLALQLADDPRPAGRPGTWFVDLGRVIDPELVVYSVAEALGIREDPGESLADSIGDALAEAPGLIVLDTCEHLRAAVADLVLVLAARCPGVTFLATSREPLGVAGERLYQVHPLSLPPAGESVELFVDRARAFLPEFQLTDGNAEDVARACRSLDGLPLAIELAVADLKVLSVAQLADRLSESLGVLSHGMHGWPDRHRTLRDMISWSHDRLGDRERVLFRRLAVFRSGFDLRTAEAVCAGRGLGPEDVAAGLAELVSRSLVMAEGGSCRQLDTIREYGSRRLTEFGETGMVLRKLAGHCLSAHRRQAGPGRQPGGSSPEDVDADLQTALAWCANSDPELGLRVAVVAAQRWAWRGYPAEARHWLERLGQTAQRPSALAIKAELEIAKIAYLHGGYDEMRARIDTAMRQLDTAPDPGLLAVARRLSGLAAHGSGDNAGAIEAFRQSLRSARERGDRWAQAQALGHIGCALASLDYLAEAREQLHQSIAIRDSLGQRGPSHMIRTVLAMVTLKLGDTAQAREILAAALDIASRAGDMRVLASLDVAACVAAVSGDLATAFLLSGASAGMLERSGLRPPPDWTRVVAEALESARRAVPLEELERLTAQGQGMSAKEAIQLAAIVARPG